MISFFQDLISGSPMLLQCLAAVVLCAIACGITGCYVVLRRESYVVGAVSHSLLGGIGLALLLQGAFPALSWLGPWHGALAAALTSAAVIAWGGTVWKLRTDTVLSAVWAIGMAIGLTCIAALPGYPPDLNSYLFGSILIIGTGDLVMMAILDAILVVAVKLLHHRFVTLAFNPELLLLRGITPQRIGMILEFLTAITVVVIARLVGIVLCMALLLLPVATAFRFCRRIGAIMLAGAVICACCATLGIALSYDVLPGTSLMLPAGATIIEVAGLVYLVSAIIVRRKS